MDSREELSQSSDLLDTPSSPTQSLLSNLSLTDDSTPDQNITTSLRVIGDVVDAIDSPVTLNIIYNNEIVTAGGEFLPSQVVSQPRVEVGGHLGTFYTLVIVNPDAPSPRNPSLKEYMHWLVTDIPGNSEASLETLLKSTILRQLLLSISIVEGKEIWVEANCKIHIILSS
uniref:FLOWERING LOCUS T-like 2-2 n=1 Tax=Chenopodium ficifolium TaxID=887860 RepID=A0A514YA93_9CARY|nr:FLOWERING LOCUS T-like 2-2 [Chenopodium ficifolium]